MHAARMCVTRKPQQQFSRTKREGLSDAISIHRVAYHLLKKTEQEGRERDEHTIPTVGWLHQLCSAHEVHLRHAPQVASLETKAGTTVVKLLATAMWTPPQLWTTLQKGKAHVLKPRGLLYMGIVIATLVVTPLHLIST